MAAVTWVVVLFPGLVTREVISWIMAVIWTGEVARDVITSKKWFWFSSSLGWCYF